MSVGYKNKVTKDVIVSEVNKVNNDVKEIVFSDLLEISFDDVKTILSSSNKNELIKLAKENGIKIGSKDKKEVLIEKITNATQSKKSVDDENIDDISENNDEENNQKVKGKKNKKKDTQVKKIMSLINQRLDMIVNDLGKKLEEYNIFDNITEFLQKFVDKRINENKKLPSLENEISKTLDKKKTSVKNPSNAYIIFSNDNRNQVRETYDLSVHETSRKLGELWKDLPTEERKKYEDLANEDKNRFIKEVEQMKETDEKNKFLQKVNKMKNKKSSDQSSEGVNKEKSEKKNPYIEFCKEMRGKVQEENPDLDSKKITSKLAEMWKSLSEDEKNKYRNEKKEVTRKQELTSKKINELKQLADDLGIKYAGNPLKKELVEIILREENNSQGRSAVFDDVKNQEVEKELENSSNEDITSSLENINKLKVTELKKLAKKMNIEINSKMLKKDLINLIKEKNSSKESIEKSEKEESIEKSEKEESIEKSEKEESKDITKLTLNELTELAKKLNIEFKNKILKDDLIKLIQEKIKNVEEEEKEEVEEDETDNEEDSEYEKSDTEDEDDEEEIEDDE